MHVTLAIAIEIVLSTLLAVTLFYCAVLERRLSHLRKGQDGLKQTIAELNSAIVSASGSMRSLKETTSQAADALDDRLARSRGMADELSLLVSSGERIAERIAGQRTHRDHAPGVMTPAVLAGRLEALKPQALRNVR